MPWRRPSGRAPWRTPPPGCRSPAPQPAARRRARSVSAQERRAHAAAPPHLAVARHVAHQELVVLGQRDVEVAPAQGPAQAALGDNERDGGRARGVPLHHTRKHNGAVGASAGELRAVGGPSEREHRSARSALASVHPLRGDRTEATARGALWTPAPYPRLVAQQQRLKRARGEVGAARSPRQRRDRMLDAAAGAEQSPERVPHLHKRVSTKVAVQQHTSHMTCASTRVHTKVAVQLHTQPRVTWACTARTL